MRPYGTNTNDPHKPWHGIDVWRQRHNQTYRAIRHHERVRARQAGKAETDWWFDIDMVAETIYELEEEAVQYRDDVLRYEARAAGLLDSLADPW
jgi:hypothetical protein